MAGLGNLPDEGAQTSSGSTNYEVVKFNYKWTINNINLCTKDDPKIKSPIFSMVTSTHTYLWSLEINKNEHKGCYIFLHLESDIDDEIIVKTKYTGSINGETSFNIRTCFGEDHFLDKDRKKIDSVFKNDQNLYITNTQLSDKNNIIILFEGECTLSTKISEKLNMTDLLKTNADLSVKAIEDILNFLYTGQITNVMNLHEGLLIAGDNMKLKQQFEEKLLSLLNIEKAAEICKLLFLHGNTEVKKKVMRFIKNNKAAVMATKGWRALIELSDLAMITEIISAALTNESRNNDDVKEDIKVPYNYNN